VIAWVSVSNELSTNPQNHTTVPFGTGAAGLSAFGTGAAGLSAFGTGEYHIIADLRRESGGMVVAAQPLFRFAGVMPRPAPASRRVVSGLVGRECAAGPAVSCEPAGRRGPGRCGCGEDPGHGRCWRVVRLRGRGRPDLVAAAVARGSVSASTR
jgi:hypothetical protein